MKHTSWCSGRKNAYGRADFLYSSWRKRFILIRSHFIDKN